jgi:hypothetical protein
VVLAVLLVAIAIAILALAWSLCAVRRGRDKQQQRQRRHFGGGEHFIAYEKVPGPAHGQSETRCEFGLNAPGHPQGCASLKPDDDLPPFHVSAHSSTIVQPCFVSTLGLPS